MSMITCSETLHQQTIQIYNMGKAKGPRKKSMNKLEDLGDMLERFRTSMDNLDKIEEMEEVPLATTIHKEFEIDTDKIETLEDVKDVIKELQVTIYWYSEECPEKFEKIYSKGLLKEIKNENI